MNSEQRRLPLLRALNSQLIDKDSLLLNGSTRRSMLKRSLLLGIGATAGMGLLGACGGDDDDSSTDESDSEAGTTDGEIPTTDGAEAAGDDTTPESDQSEPDTEDRAGGELAYAVTREPDRLDPTQSSIAPAQVIFVNIYDCLIARAPDNSYYPWLAESWEISDDGTRYIFNLRSDVTFHDGTPFNAEAVKYMMDRIHNPDAVTRVSPGAYGYYELVETPEEFVAEIILSSPWAPFLDALSFIYRVISPTAGEEYGDELARNPVGSGPFVFEEWIPDSLVRLSKNPDYNWASPMFERQGPAFLDELTFRQIPEASARVAAFESNEVQIIEVVPPQDAERLMEDSSYELLVGLVPGRPYGFTLNMRKPPTNELEVRQALNYGLDREAIVQTVFGPFQQLDAYSAAYGMLVPITYGYTAEAELYDYDPERAAELLESAGWTLGSDGIREKNGEPLHIILGTWENGIVEVMQAQWREIGIDTEIIVGPVVATNEAARREEVHMSPLPAARSDPGVLESNHSKNREGGFDFTFHEIQELDDLLDAGAVATSEEERLEIYGEVQILMMENAMFIPVFHRDTVTGRRTEVAGEIIFDRGFFPYLYNTYYVSE